MYGGGHTGSDAGCTPLSSTDAPAFGQAPCRVGIPSAKPPPLTFLASSMRMSCMEIWAKGGRS